MAFMKSLFYVRKPFQIGFIDDYFILLYMLVYSLFFRVDIELDKVRQISVILKNKRNYFQRITMVSAMIILSNIIEYEF